MSTVPPVMPQQPGMPAPKKSSPLVWILAGIGGFLVLCFVGCGLFAFYAIHKVKEIGFDPELWKKNPGLAMTKLAAAAHPDMDVVSTNDNAGTITMRDKTTGKEATFKIDPDKGTMTIQTADGTLNFGANSAHIPSWVPVYPGSSPQGAFSAQAADANSGTWSFKTTDAVDKVLSYYQDQLKSAGMTVTLTTVGAGGGLVSAESSDKNRTAIVTVANSTGTTEGSITVTEKK